MRKQIKCVWLMAAILLLGFGVMVNPAHADIGTVVKINNEQSVADIQAKIQKALNDPDVVSVALKGEKTNADTTLTLNIPANKHINWQADWTSTAEPAIELKGDGMVRVQVSAAITGPNNVIASDIRLVLTSTTISATGGDASTAIRLQGKGAEGSALELIQGIVEGDSSEPGLITIKGDVVFAETGLNMLADNKTKARIEGNIKADGVSENRLLMKSGEMTITGDIELLHKDEYEVYVRADKTKESTAKLVVEGDIKSTDLTPCLFAEGYKTSDGNPACEVTIGGDVIGRFLALNHVRVTVKGNVTRLYDRNAMEIGEGAQVTVKGDIEVKEPDKYGVYLQDTPTITWPKLPRPGTVSHAGGTYYKYENTASSGIDSALFVKVPGTPEEPGEPGSPGTPPQEKQVRKRPAISSPLSPTVAVRCLLSPELPVRK